MTDDLANVEVGTKLFICGGGDYKGRIEVVVRVTPTGRIVTRTGTFDRNGRLRGEIGSWHRHYARIATDDDIAGVNRWALVNKLKGINWDKLPAEQLKAINEIISNGHG